MKDRRCFLLGSLAGALGAPLVAKALAAGKSQVGQGSTFTFMIPVRRGE